jgi:hypothetical protein
MNKEPRRPKTYRVVHVRDYPSRIETYTVEGFDGANVVLRVTGFSTQVMADAWIAEQTRARRDEPT